MSERLVEKLDRLGAEAGIETMTPEIRRFALLVRADVVAEWPSKPWVGLSDGEIARIVSLAGFDPEWVEAKIATQIVRTLEAKLKEKNT